MNPRLKLQGLTFGRLTVLEFSHVDVRTFWRCRCECGNEKTVQGSQLRSGVVRSCGCLKIEAVCRNVKRATEAKRMPFPHARRLTNLFEDMRKRCYSPSTKAFKNYGGRGIVICAEWMADRHAFYRWATEHGYAPGLTIERDDVNGNYEAANCRFIPRAEQGHNTTRSHFVEWGGRRLTVTKWAAEVGLPSRILLQRFARGWSVERALSQPMRPAA